MINPAIQKELLVALDSLPEEAQRRVAEFANSLSTRQPSGAGHHALLQLSGSIEREDLRMMDEAIREGCERIPAGGW